MEKTIHQGRNIKRFREMLGIKQDVLAIDLGISQQAISALEQKEALDQDMLNKIASILKVPAEAIKNFDEEAAFNIISNTYNNTSNDTSTMIASSVNFQPTFNPIDKLVELYEELLKVEREKIALLERLMEKK